MRDVTRRGRLFRIALGATLLVLIFFAGRTILYHQIRNAVEKELDGLREQKIIVKYDQLEVDPWQGLLRFRNLRVSVQKADGTVSGLDATVPRAVVSGVQVMPYLIKRRLSVNRLVVENITLSYTKGVPILKDDNSGKRSIQLKSIAVREIDFPGINLYIREGKAEDTLAYLQSNVSLRDILLLKQLDSMIWQQGSITVENLKLESYADHLSYAVGKMKCSISDHSITMDSIHIRPMLSRAAYMRFLGKQGTYVNAHVPSAELRGVRWMVYPVPRIDVSSVTTRFELELFMDKRYPFLQKKERKLPIDLLHDLPFSIGVDTLLIKKSFIRYEEHPEEGDTPGEIYFEDLYATILNVHNDPKSRKEMEMKTLSRFMGKGTLEARFTFPSEPSKRYTVSGSLQEMPMESVNGMLAPAARVKIESGFMNRLSFNFSYTRSKSTGEVLMNYHDLKVATLRGDNGTDDISPVKTFLLNTFLIKKDMTEDMPEDKRTGTIEHERDLRRSVFNYWWKSILSGLQSAHNLDKLPIGKSPENKQKKKTRVGKLLSDIFVRE